ncbi:hypothetical protein Z517_09306 [Fonsecaea pedrosoi CBS 271.37]|uniref:Uncharacterized protein n=1 Tax=Fonsecaea pedrosoi CBS 271.37 TaxID=1442368 RepID=A0A0D2ERI0_9EURO|nr:uncharacterized protein Z517_09306 [Fonsecaea pedrosoi CBS 271.37]KIW76862.1 hypothetical protein Z517_09306 [Fonsecaea pedrosoi CBS 271.37]
MPSPISNVELVEKADTTNPAMLVKDGIVHRDDVRAGEEGRIRQGIIVRGDVHQGIRDPELTIARLRECAQRLRLRHRENRGLLRQRPRAHGHVREQNGISVMDSMYNVDKYLPWDWVSIFPKMAEVLNLPLKLDVDEMMIRPRDDYDVIQMLIYKTRDSDLHAAIYRDTDSIFVWVKGNTEQVYMNAGIKWYYQSIIISAKKKAHTTTEIIGNMSYSSYNNDQLGLVHMALCVPCGGMVELKLGPAQLHNITHRLTTACVWEVYCAGCAEKDGVLPPGVKEDEVMEDSVNDSSDGVKEDDVKPDEVMEDDVKEDNVNDSSDGVKQDDVKEDDVKEDDVKQDDVKQDDVKQDDVKEDDVKEDGVKEDDVKQDNVKEDDVKQDDVKEDDVKPDEVMEDDVKEDNVNDSSDGVKQDDVKEDGVKEDDVKEDDVKEDDVKQDDVREDAVMEDDVMAGRGSGRLDGLTNYADRNGFTFNDLAMNKIRRTGKRFRKTTFPNPGAYINIFAFRRMFTPDVKAACVHPYGMSMDMEMEMISNFFGMDKSIMTPTIETELVDPSVLLAAHQQN